MLDTWVRVQSMLLLSSSQQSVHHLNIDRLPMACTLLTKRASLLTVPATALDQGQGLGFDMVSVRIRARATIVLTVWVRVLS